MRFTQATLAVSAFAAAANAHIIMTFPPPWGGDKGNAKDDKISQSPLDASGSNFPCQIPLGGTHLDGTTTTWKAGETKQVAFRGTAVHGGGSCQFSLTTDKNPTPKSDWRVIQSNIGGCPFNTAGNIEYSGVDAASRPIPTTFPVTMPQDLPDGDYVFAWTWFNKIGNREMYMNCAPLSVTGGGSNANLLQSLPTMMTANIGNQCATTEGTDPVFDNPGSSVVTSPNASKGKFTGSGCKSSAGTGGSSGGGGGQASGSAKPSAPAASSPAASYPASPATSQAAAPSNPGGVFAPGASGAASSKVATTFATQPAATSAAAQPPAATAPSNPSSGNGTSGSVACTNEGGVVCIGTSQFGLCDHGAAVPMALAAGMSCSNGQIQKRAVHPHIHRRHGSRLL